MTFIMRTGFKNQSGSQEIRNERFYHGKGASECLDKIRTDILRGPQETFNEEHAQRLEAIDNVIPSKVDEYVKCAQDALIKHTRLVNEIKNCKTAKDFTFLSCMRSPSSFFFVERIYTN